MIIADKEDCAISTVVIRGSTDNLLDDIERAVDDGVNTFKVLVRVSLHSKKSVCFVDVVQCTHHPSPVSAHTNVWSEADVGLLILYFPFTSTVVCLCLHGLCTALT